MPNTYCRRQATRAKLTPSAVTCWNATRDPRTVTVVEADVHGARLLLPFSVRTGETVRVSFTDSLGQHQTRAARVAWTHLLESTAHTMVGLAFSEKMQVA